DRLWTSGDRRSAAPTFFPAGVDALPSIPWQLEQCAWKVCSACPDTPTDKISKKPSSSSANIVTSCIVPPDGCSRRSQCKGAPECWKVSLWVRQIHRCIGCHGRLTCGCWNIPSKRIDDLSGERCRGSRQFMFFLLGPREKALRFFARGRRLLSWRRE